MEKFLTAMDDDFNTALGVGHIFELIREANKYLDSKPSGQKARACLKDNGTFKRGRRCVEHLQENT